MATQSQAPPQFLVKQDPRAQNLRGMLEASRHQLEMALPSHIKADRFIRVALTSVSKTPALLECSPKSVLASILEAAQLGLMCDGILGEAYLVPYKGVCQLQPGYRGLISLARRSGQVSNFYSELIFKCDKYKVTLGLAKTLEHEPDWENAERGATVLNHETKAQEFVIPLVGAYSVVHFKDGAIDFEYMPIGLLNQIRATSKTTNPQTPWFTNPAEMYRKTPIRRIAKRLPLSPEFQRAAILDEYADAGKVIDANESLVGASVAFSVAADATADHLAAKYGQHEEVSQDGPTVQTSETPSASTSEQEVAQSGAGPQQPLEPGSTPTPAAQDQSQPSTKPTEPTGETPQGLPGVFGNSSPRGQRRHRDLG